MIQKTKILLRFFPHSQTIISGPSATPFVTGFGDTWDTKGSHGPVCFSQPGAGSGKRVCSIKLCFCQRVIQPNITVIFGGTGRGIVDFYKQAYEYDVLLF